MKINNPVSTYRIQFHKEFSFDAFEHIISYLQKLGVQTIYASPIFKSVPGSNHGYDGVDPLAINPEIGSLDQFKGIHAQLKQNDMMWLQDIVPNHMAFHTQNEWLMDVLEKGQRSAYYSFFDIDWQSEEYNGKLMTPFLGEPLQQVIQNGEIKIVFENKRFHLKYFETTWPLNSKGYEEILKQNDQQFSELLAQLQKIDQINDAGKYAKAWTKFLSMLNNRKLKDQIIHCSEKVNSDKELLQKIIEEQYFRPCYWKETDTKINYRRFFTVNGLICLNIQEKNVFEKYHQLIDLLIKDGIFQGLRVDHIDGLYDPAAYLQQLKQLTGDETYIVVEKILQPGEALPEEWQTEGTTGYDFLALVNNLFTNKKAREPFCDFYEDFTGEYLPPEEQLPDKKAHILYHHMSGELDNLFRLLLGIVDKKLLASVYPADLKEALGEFLVNCPVYRYYIHQIPLEGEEAAAIANILFRIREAGDVNRIAIDLLHKVFFEMPNQTNDEYKGRLLHFLRRCMQFTGPLMAKGLEDTLMYTYNNFIAHNDVGDSPQNFGIDKDVVDREMTGRQKKWPLALNTTSTHDTKRGEDVRARLNVLSDLPGEWFEHVQKWREENLSLKQQNIPNANEEYFIYQSLIGAYPMPGSDEDNFEERFKEYLQKSLREAKTNSGWAEPNDEYEEAVKDFAAKLLDKRNAFWKSFDLFHKKVSDFGIINSLSQLLLKFTCPGVPDVYQGCELWDLSFVDPDNRRAVNYQYRMRLLDELGQEENKEKLFQSLWKNRNNGQIKLWLTQELFKLRKQQAEFFEKAEYVPLKTKGEYGDYVFAFARKLEEKCLVVAVPLHVAELCQLQNVEDFFSIDWKDTCVDLPRRLKHKAENIFLNDEIETSKKLTAENLFKQLPVALLRVESEENVRNAGVLLHITSLPSEFGIGDMGPEAYAFADWLNRCHQKIWQMLPLNPVDAAQGYSPYSSISSAAGNTLLISPELLANENLLDKNELDQLRREKNSKADFDEAMKIKNKIFDNLWQNIKGSKYLQKEFEEFSEKEAGWLDDFALYSVTKSQQEGKPWFQWPEEIKRRNKEALQKIACERSDELNKIKFLQFIFTRQWQQFKKYCNNKGIKLLGDLAFYVSYDSVDVWSHPEIFSIDENGDLLAVAGTPPDAFSEEGQLWGMPVFRWDVLKEKDYKWWIDRIKRNRQNFDLVRLDHFRAFSAYWEIPANQSAKYGSWKPGPGIDFFETLKSKFGDLPFVAEDLGEIDDAVIELRDHFNMPGMKVLQFAFDENMPDSDYIPHHYKENFIVYTGTHDNNTTKGWYKSSDDNKRNRISKYAGINITEENIASGLMRLAYASIAKTAILPLQDILNLDEWARLNIPSASNGNWSWRLMPGQLSKEIENKLKEWVWLYDRN